MSDQYGVNGPIEKAFIAFLQTNKNPPDDAVHEWAESNGYEVDKVEAIAYRLVSQLTQQNVPAGKSKEEASTPPDPKQLEMGKKVEEEHTPVEPLKKQIAKDHLAEMPDYYTQLKKMEDNEGCKTAVARAIAVAKFGKEPDALTPLDLSYAASFAAKCAVAGKDPLELLKAAQIPPATPGVPGTPNKPISPGMPSPTNTIARKSNVFDMKGQGMNTQTQKKAAVRMSDGLEITPAYLDGFISKFASRDVDPVDLLMKVAQEIPDESVPEDERIDYEARRRMVVKILSALAGGAGGAALGGMAGSQMGEGHPALGALAGGALGAGLGYGGGALYSKLRNALGTSVMGTPVSSPSEFNFKPASAKTAQTNEGDWVQSAPGQWTRKPKTAPAAAAGAAGSTSGVQPRKAGPLSAAWQYMVRNAPAAPMFQRITDMMTPGARGVLPSPQFKVNPVPNMQGGGTNELASMPWWSLKR